MFHPSSQKSHMVLSKYKSNITDISGGWANAFSPQKNQNVPKTTQRTFRVSFSPPKKTPNYPPNGNKRENHHLHLGRGYGLSSLEGNTSNTSNLHRSKLQLSRGQFLLDFLSPCGRWGHWRGSRWVAVHFNGFYKVTWDGTCVV